MAPLRGKALAQQRATLAEAYENAHAAWLVGREYRALLAAMDAKIDVARSEYREALPRLLDERHRLQTTRRSFDSDVESMAFWALVDDFSPPRERGTEAKYAEDEWLRAWIWICSRFNVGRQTALDIADVDHRDYERAQRKRGGKSERDRRALEMLIAEEKQALLHLQSDRDDLAAAGVVTPDVGPKHAVKLIEADSMARYLVDELRRWRHWKTDRVAQRNELIRLREDRIVAVARAFSR